MYSINQFYPIDSYTNGEIKELGRLLSVCINNSIGFWTHSKAGIKLPELYGLNREQEEEENHLDTLQLSKKIFLVILFYIFIEQSNM